MKEQDYNIKMINQSDNGANYRIDVRIPMSAGWIEDVYFCTVKDGKNFNYKLKHQKNDNEYVYFGADVFLETCGVYRYFFQFKANGYERFLDRDSYLSNYLSNNKLGKLSVNFETPEWAKGALMYHIFVDRFNRGSKEPLEVKPRRNIYPSFDTPLNPGPDKDGIWNNDFYGGDLKGITEKLSYIKSLGTDIIYLSPIFESQSNHRYDTGDYENVDPYCGNNEDLKELCDKAHSMGMKIVLDSVFNHTGNDSKYYNEFGSYNSIGACQDINSYYGSFYRKHYGKDGKLYNDHWWGMPNLPVCDGSSKNWQQYIYGENGVIDKWFDLGIDGLRLDVADELSDTFIEEIRNAVHRNKKDGLILGEVWKNPMRMGRGYILSGKGMDSVMDYSLIDALIRYYKYADTYKLGYIIQDILNEYPKDTIDTLMNFTSTHDISRAINIFANYDFNEYEEWVWKPFDESLSHAKNYNLCSEEIKKAKEILKSYTFGLDFLPGIFSIFYGDEVGVQGYGNLMNRQPFPWNNMDKDLLNHFKYLGSVRKDNEFLKTADLNVVDITKNYFMFERTSENGDALIAVNRTPDDTNIFIPPKYDGTDISKTYSLNKSKKTSLSPYGGISLIKK